MLLTANSAFAQSIVGEITAIDPVKKTFSVSASAEEPKSYRLRMAPEIFLNGAKSKLDDFAVGMAIKVTSGETGVASKIEVTGTPFPAGTAPVGTFESRLTGTKWIWGETKDMVWTLKFNKDGTAQWTQGVFSWKVMPSGGHRVEGTTSYGKKYKMTFNENLTAATLYLAGKPPKLTKRAD